MDVDFIINSIHVNVVFYDLGVLSITYVTFILNMYIYTIKSMISVNK